MLPIFNSDWLFDARSPAVAAVARKGDMLMKIINSLKGLCQDESGQDLIEYALIAALISVASIAAMQTLAGKINNEFGYVSNQIT